MSNLIQVKRGVLNSLPALSAGEFGFCTDTFQVFIGSSAGNQELATGAGGLPAHALAGADHTASSLTVGYVVRASGATTFAWAQLQHSDLGSVGDNDHHNEIHVVNSTGPHAESGLTAGYVLRASAAAAFAFAQLQHADLGGVTADLHHAQAHVLATTGPHTGTLPWSDLSKSGSDLADLATKAHSSLTGVTADLHHAQAHVVDSSGPHAQSGLTAGYVLRASAAAAFTFAQLQHADLGGVTADLHHAQAHVLATTGPHTGTLPWSDLSKSGSDLADLATRAHSSLTGVTADLHHNQAHALTGADHTLAGATATHALLATGTTTFAFGYVAALASSVAMQASATFSWGAGGSFQYLEGSAAFAWGVNGNKMNLNATKLSLLTSEGLALMGTNRRVTFDANDYLQFAGNLYYFYVGSVPYLTLGTVKGLFHAIVELDKTGTADVNIQCPSFKTRWVASGWDTTLTQADDLEMDVRLSAGSGATGAIPHTLEWNNFAGTTVMELNALTGVLKVEQTKVVLHVDSAINGGSF